MSIIAAGTTTTTALSSTGNTDGTLQFQVNGTTPSVTLNTLGAVGVGASPNFGSSGQVLTSAGSTAAPTWATPAPVNLATGVTGTLPVANGGTGQTALSAVAVGTSTNLAGGSNGTIPYQSAAGTTQMLAVGTPGQVLQTNGAGAPSWVTPAGGSWVFLSSVTANNSATVDITDGISTTYKQYALVVSNFRPVNSGISLLLRQRTGGTYQTTGYNYFLDRSNSGSGALSSRSTSGDAIYILENQNGTAQNTGVVIYLNNPAYTPASPNTTAHMVYWVGASNGGNICVAQGAGGLPSETAAVTGYRFLTSNGNIATGTFSLYGIANS